MPKPINLVLSGGGVNGIAHTGAIIELLDNGYLDHVQRIMGTSVGAFIGGAVALNFNKQEYLDFLNNLHFPQFLHSPSIFRFFKRYGFFSGQIIRNMINEQIEKKTGLKKATFADLHKLKQKYHFKELYVTVVNVSKGKIEIFSHETTPKAQIADAIYASMAIPFLFEAMLLKKEKDGRFIKNADGEIFIDGGTIDNYHLHFFDKFDERTLGLFLVDPKIHNRLGLQQEAKATHYRSFFEYSTEVIETIVFRQKSHTIEREGSDRTIFINDLGNKQYNFYLNQQMKDTLFESGKKAARAYVEKDRNEQVFLRSKL